MALSPTDHEETRTGQRILLLTHRLPYPPDRGDRIRAYHLLRALAGRHRVTLASISERPASPDQRAELDRLCDRVLIRQVRPMHQRFAGAWGLMTGRPGTPTAMFHRGLSQRLVALHRAQPFDAVITFCSGMAGYTAALQQAGMAEFGHIMDLCDIDSAKWAAYADSASGPMRHVYAAEARRLRHVEAGRTTPFDAVTVISHAEAEVYQQTVSNQTRPVVVGNGVDLDYFGPEPPTARPVCVFTGVMSYKPNIDAVTWFARQVWPAVCQAMPGRRPRFDIVGKDPSPAVRALSQIPGVNVTGTVPDTRPYLANAALAVAPLMIAPGVQNKVLEAMASARPVVCSHAAAAGIHALPGEELIVADHADAVASAVIRLLGSPDTARAIGQAARRRVEADYNWSSAMAPMLDLIEQLGAASSSTRRTPSRAAA